MKDKMSPEYQRDVSEFVEREVIYCVSSLIYDLSQNGQFQQELWDEGLLGRDDWQTPAEENGWEEIDGEIVKVTPLKDIDDDDVKYSEALDDEEWEALADEAKDQLRKDYQAENTPSASSWQDACEQDDLDPYTDEVYEHWIVSRWLADKLEAKGEVVCHDFHGLTIWGRCTTGQSISLDYVICQIYDDLHEGEES